MRCNAKDIVYAGYHFHPENKTVFREVLQYQDRVEIYMDYEETLNQPYTHFETLFWLPDEYDSNHEPIGTAGEFLVSVGGVGVINENNAKRVI